MPNLFDYIAWRGDLSFLQSPFNAVDSLILCCLSYLRFDGVVPGLASKKGVTVRQAAAKYLGSILKDTPEKRLRGDDKLLHMMARSQRFSSMVLTNYVDRFDAAAEKQFAAITILLENPQKELYIAFRGTDHTLVGWKEDFNMAYMPVVPSQADAVAYLNEVAPALSGGLRLGGHSKGGNLAIFSAARCKREIQERICAVYSNDGPGFSSNLLESEDYLRIRDRIHTFIPQTSIVGMLLDHEDDYTVIKSRQHGPLQHYPYSWEVLGPDFVRMKTITSTSRVIDRTLKNWVSGMSIAQREQFVDSLYRAFGAGRASTFSDLPGVWMKNISVALKSRRDIKPQNQQFLKRTLTKLSSIAKNES